MNNMKMLYFDRSDASEGFVANKTSKSKEYNICHYWCFLDKSFKFQPNFCNGCDDLWMISINLRDIAILKIKSFDYRCIITGISKGQAAKLFQNIDFTEKSATL